MKKIIFLILFLTGLFPVFNSNGLYLESGKVYGQEDPYGNEVVICSEPDRVTTYEYLSYYEVETCVFDNEGGVATNDCEWVCDSQYYDYPPDPDDDPDGDGSGTGSGGGSSGGGSSGGGTSLTPKQIQINNAVNELNKNALLKSSGKCARYVRFAIEAQGVNTQGHPVSAKDYSTFLPSKGFQTVSKTNYTPMKGDIVVFDSFTGHPHGHIQMYNGTKWVSDFFQNGFWPGTSYYNAQPNYSIFRK